MKPVGGAAGIGCAGFGLVGLLVSIGIVAYLSSQTADSVSRSPVINPTTLTTPDGTDLTPGNAGNLTIPGATLAGAKVKLQGSGQLNDLGTVKVVGSGLPPGPIQISICLTKDYRTADGTSGCDASTTAEATVDGGGNLLADYTVHRVASSLDVPYDCAAFANACSVVVHPANAYDDGPQAGLVFARGLPPVDADPPAT